MSCAAIEKRPVQQVGRYTICDQLASGGMATVHLARLVGSAGFSRVVAAKRMHPHFLADPEFRKMFLAEAQLAARIQHPNVVPILDVLSLDDELIIFMDYVHGEALHSLMLTTLRDQQPVPLPVACAIVAAALQGLHAAHEARSESGEPLGIVHRDVSPQNILVGADGVARVLDFGIAKALRAQNLTDPGTIKGKFSYMAPEVISGGAITRQTDVFSAGVILWELLAGKKLFGGTSDQERIVGIIRGDYPSPRAFNPRVSEALERVVAKALQVDPNHRFANALQFAIALEVASPLASQHVVGEWVRHIAASILDERMNRIHEIETSVVNMPARLSLPPLQSLTVPASRGRVGQSILTTVSSPTAKRRIIRRRGLTTILGVALLAALGFGIALRPRSGTSEAQRAETSTLVPQVIPTPSSIPATKVGMKTAPPESVAAASDSAPQAQATTDSIESPQLRKPASSRALTAPHTRAKSPSHAKKYLPSEL